MATCGVLGNLGTPCGFNMKNVRTLIFVPLLNAAGTENLFETASAVTKSALQAKFDAADIKNRFFPVHGFKNASIVPADTKMAERTDGSMDYITDAIYTFKGILPKKHFYLVEKIMKLNGQNFGVWIGDANHNFVYITDATTLLKVKPILVDGGSLVAKPVFATDEDTNYIDVSFNFSLDNKMQLINMLEYDNLDFDVLSEVDVYSLTDVDKLVTVTGDVNSIVLTLKTDYNAPVEGLTLAAGFQGANALYNTTDTAAVTILSVTETSAGVYLITFAAQTVSDELLVTPVKTRFSFNEGDGYSVTLVAS